MKTTAKNIIATLHWHLYDGTIWVTPEVNYTEQVGIRACDEIPNGLRITTDDMQRFEITVRRLTNANKEKS